MDMGSTVSTYGHGLEASEILVLFVQLLNRDFRQWIRCLTLHSQSYCTHSLVRLVLLCRSILFAFASFSPLPYITLRLCIHFRFCITFELSYANMTHQLRIFFHFGKKQRWPLWGKAIVAASPSRLACKRHVRHGENKET